MRLWEAIFSIICIYVLFLFENSNVFYLGEQLIDAEDDPEIKDDELPSFVNDPDVR